jgi:hypothetical protein
VGVEWRWLAIAYRGKLRLWSQAGYREWPHQSNECSLEEQSGLSQKSFVGDVFTGSCCKSLDWPCKKCDPQAPGYGRLVQGLWRGDTMTEKAIQQKCIGLSVGKEYLGVG